jgi:hypothetical protein
MRLLVLSVAMSLWIGLFSVGCGSSNTGFGNDGGTPTDGTVGNDGNPFQFPDSGSHEGGCVGLQCQQTCATTSISGTVYDPAGDIGLYNVFVYVPNAPLDPITDGPTCTQCQAPASGNPVVSATTDANGHFTIPAAPDGDNIPIVIQLGKWRRHLVIPHVTKCVDNPQQGNTLRFPRKQHETSPDDNIPLMAFTTGCDAAECFFKSRLGIDASEFTDPSGKGRVRVYISPNYPGATFPGVTAGAMTLWNTPGEMMKYDIIFDACECDTFTRGANGYKNFLDYLNAGGRAFSTHYFYNFFMNANECTADGDFNTATCQGQGQLPNVANWGGHASVAYANASKCPNNSQNYGDCLNIDTAIPKGKAFADWYKANNSKLLGGGENYGYLDLTDIRTDMGALSSTYVNAGTETPWLYAGDGTFPNTYDAYYMSVNTPVSTDSTNQCGRAIFSDVHLSGYLNGTFPSYCAADPNQSDHATDELALEFLFFDLASCVQNDTQAPVVPH